MQVVNINKAQDLVISTVAINQKNVIIQRKSGLKCWPFHIK